MPRQMWEASSHDIPEGSPIAVAATRSVNMSLLVRHCQYIKSCAKMPSVAEKDPASRLRLSKVPRLEGRITIGDNVRMRRTIALFLALMGLTATAGAQALGLTVRAGAFFPTTSAARADGESWYTAGAEFDLFRLPVPAAGFGAAIAVSIDTYGRSGSSSVPIMVNFSARSSPFRYTAGVGASFVRRSGFEESFQFAYQLGISYEVIKGAVPVMLELRYVGVANTNNFFDGLAATVGVRL